MDNSGGENKGESQAAIVGNGRATRGRVGEQAAQALLERRGYTIVDINVRSGKSLGVRGEIDIIAWDGPTLCFVEVKTRQGVPGRVQPAEAVTFSKQRQIARLAVAYAARHGLLEGDAEIPLRFDLVSVFLAPGDSENPRVLRMDILPGAFLAPDGFED